jgi:hypothetical protein
MPYRMWGHFCQGREVLIPSPDCSVCGAHGAFYAWRLSVREAASRYRYVYELEPSGPHRPLADRLLAPMRTSCVRCSGHAVLTIDVGAWTACPTCEGTGGIWNRPPQEVEAVRRRILTAVVPAKPVRPPEPNKPSRSRRRSRRTGYSSHGLSFADVERAFAEAEQVLGTDWKLKGRGHCRRATLDPRYSCHARKGAGRSSAEVFIVGGPRRKRVMSLAIIERAAEILGVAPTLLVCREY